MSLVALNHVWNNCPLVSGTELIAFLSLADRADDHGSCYPSIEDSAKRLRRSESVARRAIKWLVRHRYVIVQHGKGCKTDSGWTNRYWIVIVGWNCDSYEQLCEKLKVSPVPLPTAKRHNRGGNNPEGKNGRTNNGRKDGVLNSTGHGVLNSTGHGVLNSTGEPSLEPSLEPRDSVAASGATAGNSEISSSQIDTQSLELPQDTPVKITLYSPSHQPSTQDASENPNPVAASPEENIFPAAPVDNGLNPKSGDKTAKPKRRKPNDGMSKEENNWRYDIAKSYGAYYLGAEPTDYEIRTYLGTSQKGSIGQFCTAVKEICPTFTEFTPDDMTAFLTAYEKENPDLPKLAEAETMIKRFGAWWRAKVPAQVKTRADLEAIQQAYMIARGWGDDKIPDVVKIPLKSAWQQVKNLCLNDEGIRLRLIAAGYGENLDRMMEAAK